MAAEWKVDFKHLKSKVGVDDIAYHLGYRLDRAAGIGRYIEMVLPDGSGGVRDKIVIQNPNNKAEQLFFRRDGSKMKDVISLIQENINTFHVTGTSLWEKTAQVMAHFANEPIPEYGNSAYLYKAGYTGEQVFDPKRYEAQPFSGTNRYIMRELANRGFTEDTIRTFSPVLMEVRDTHNTKFVQPNLGFPYREPGKDEVVGFEIRGYNGWKGKAAGTNSNSAAWIVDLSHHQDRDAVQNVYFAESGYDIMALYQANRQKLCKECAVFVSLGGTFSEKQITGIMQYYTQARAIDCFDNDLPGRVYGIKMAALLENIPVAVIKSGREVQITSGNKEIRLDEEKVSLAEFRKNFPVRYKIGQWKAPSFYKDWNDVVINKPVKEIAHATLFQRNENLEKARQMKM